jgi:hypothetical protein
VPLGLGDKIAAVNIAPRHDALIKLAKTRPQAPIRIGSKRGE